MAAKRSPILGYNHNVRYRGVVFHVQTEDSGQLNPHLFTHLFHEGVIVSTRKLVYDAGSNEDAIKALMQAQHKAVMKDLRKGTFDDKIDTYLGGTPGLEPRTGADPATPIPRGTRAQTEQSPPPEEVIAAAKAQMSMAGEPDAASPIEIVNEGLSEPIELPLKHQAPPAPDEIDPPTLTDAHAEEMINAIQAVNVQPTQSRTKTAERTSKSQVKQTPPIGSPTARPQAGVMPKTQPLSHVQRDPGPMLALDDDDGRARGPRDTAVSPEQFADATVPVQMPGRPASHGANALPPMKAPSRPAMQSPVVQSRAPEEDSAPVEIHAPAPPSVEPPPGERAERPGQYSVSRKDASAPMREKTGRIAAINPNSIPALARPKQGGSGSVPVVPSPAREGTGPIPTPRTQSPSAPQTGRPPTGQPPVPRVPTPQVGSPGANRVHVTAPITNRPQQSPSQPNPSSGVVMTRPAVIVGTPAKPPVPPTTQRVRKAREDEGRGFGQGLISEKSLDEVILAYLSEDAEDK